MTERRLTSIEKGSFQGKEAPFPWSKIERRVAFQCLNGIFKTFFDKVFRFVLKVENNEISVKKFDGEDYISITDMIRNKDGDFFVADWLRNRNTVEFLGIWESMNNPNFNYGEFAIVKSKVGLNNYKLSVMNVNPFRVSFIVPV